MLIRSLAALTFCIALVAGCATRASATSVVPMSDRDLAESARAIVEGAVVDRESHWDEARGLVVTYVTVDVERVYKGDLPPGLVVLRQIGGAAGDRVTEIFGAPDLEPGDRALLFLNADDDGALHVAHLALGLFRISTDAATGETRVTRPSTGTDVSPVTGERVTSVANRAGFVADVLAMLAASTAKASAGPALLISPPEFAGLRRGDAPDPSFTFLGSGFRWFEPDTGQKVEIKVNAEGGPTPSGGLDESKAVFQVWSSVSGSRLRVIYGGGTHAGGIKVDGITAISFNDPRGQIDDLVNCQGIVAMSGIAGDLSSRVTLHGKSFARLTEADLVVNNGAECIVNQWPALLPEVLTHECGHCLGLGHSSENPLESDPALRDATMYWAAHNDGRGTSIRPDDAAGIRFAYGMVAGPLALATNALPDALPDRTYAYDLRADGGSSPYAWSLASGRLPTGLSLASNGRISGPPSGSGTATFTVRVTDSAGAAQQRTLALEVTSTPSPFLQSAEYLTSRRRLQLTGRYLDLTANVTVNGARVVPGAVIRYKPKKGRLLVSGSEAALNLRGNGADTVVVSVNGRSSNTVRF